MARRVWVIVLFLSVRALAQGPGEADRPWGSVRGSWQPQADGLGVTSGDLRLNLPPIRLDEESSPLRFTLNTGLTQFTGEASGGLPPRLYTLGLNAAWATRMADRWRLRLSLGLTHASDFEASRDAVRPRAMVTAVYDAGPSWDLLFGLVLTGREDLPVLPALGAIWTPSDELRADLVMPRPKLSWRLFEGETHATWVYVSGQLNGGTWAYETRRGHDDLVTYREVRAVVGLENNRPPRAIGAPPVTRWFVETGMAFGRELEFDSNRPDTDPNESWVLAAGFGF